jgi:hypothetical protein
MGGRATRSAIAVKVFVTDGSLEFFSGHGLADIAPDRPVTEDTVFRIASITKTFTAIGPPRRRPRGRARLRNPYVRVAG